MDRLTSYVSVLPASLEATLCQQFKGFIIMIHGRLFLDTEETVLTLCSISNRKPHHGVAPLLYMKLIHLIYSLLNQLLKIVYSVCKHGVLFVSDAVAVPCHCFLFSSQCATLFPVFKMSSLYSFTYLSLMLNLNYQMEHLSSI